MPCIDVVKSGHVQSQWGVKSLCKVTSQWESLSSKFLSKQMNIAAIVDLQVACIILLGLSTSISVSKRGSIPTLHPVLTQFCIHYAVDTFLTFWHLKKTLLREKFSCFWTPSELGYLEVSRRDDPTHGSIFRSLDLNPVPFSWLESNVHVNLKICGDFFPECGYTLYSPSPAVLLRSFRALLSFYFYLFLNCLFF